MSKIFLPQYISLEVYSFYCASVGDGEQTDFSSFNDFCGNGRALAENILLYTSCTVLQSAEEEMNILHVKHNREAKVTDNLFHY